METQVDPFDRCEAGGFVPAVSSWSPPHQSRDVTDVNQEPGDSPMSCPQLRRSCTDPVVGTARDCFVSFSEGADDPRQVDIISDSGLACRRRWWRPLSQAQQRSIAETLASTLGSVALKVPTQTFLCCICLENIPMANQCIMSRCGQTSHASCEDCLKTYLRMRVDEARVDELRCPRAGEDGCTAAATEDELRRWLSKETCEKYERFSRMQADSKLRGCPHCSRLCSPEVDQTGKVVAEMMCQDCNVTFCYYHSNAHGPGKEACSQYERCMVRQQLMDAGLYGTKPCPSCGFPTEKVSGCNHMTCKCKANWCWVCGRTLDNVGWHYNPANPNGCMQFQEELGSRRDARLMVLCKLLSLPAVIVSVAFVIIFVILLLGTCCVPICTCFKDLGFKVWVGFSAFIVGLPFVIFSLAWALFALVLWCFLLPCGVGEVHLQFLLGVPFMTALAVGEGIIGPERAAGAVAVATP